MICGRVWYATYTYTYMYIYTGLWFVIHQIELVFRCLRLNVNGGENKCRGRRQEGKLGMVGWVILSMGMDYGIVNGNVGAWK